MTCFVLCLFSTQPDARDVRCTGCGSVIERRPLALSAGVGVRPGVGLCAGAGRHTDDALLSAADEHRGGPQMIPPTRRMGRRFADAGRRSDRRRRRREGAEAGGMSLGPATMFTCVAISMFCPAAMVIDRAVAVDDHPAWG